MAAETLTSTRAAAGIQPFKAHGDGLVQAAYGSFAIAANVEDGDIFEMCKVPAGAVIIGGMFYGGDLDTGTEVLDMDIGWAANGGSGTHDSADPDGLGNLGVLTGDSFAAGNLSGIAGLMYALAGILVTGVLPTFTRETTIQVEANVAANTFAAETISVVVFYVVDESIVA